jgi:hypothetical protein
MFAPITVTLFSLGPGLAFRIGFASSRQRNASVMINRQ